MGTFEKMQKIKTKRMEQFDLALRGELKDYREACCFCDKALTDIFKTHNPAPLNNEEDSVCCEICLDKFVGPARMLHILNF
tara:strand:- start:376 stop:618 length:243 start_codon:yes stop_codon:yes gene_type:complete